MQGAQNNQNLYTTLQTHMSMSKFLLHKRGTGSEENNTPMIKINCIFIFVAVCAVHQGIRDVYIAMKHFADILTPN
jgi:hypothetical protein